jgi:hypothetical protein
MACYFGDRTLGYPTAWRHFPAGFSLSLMPPINLHKFNNGESNFFSDFKMSLD